VGDSRLYYLLDRLEQMTEDQTFVAREIRSGNMTPEQAKTDPRRNMLLQCIGASPRVDPQTGRGRTRRGVYMLCSDGFRHVITENEIGQTLAPINLMNTKAMHGGARYLIDLVKARHERDNISVIVIKAE
jgi:serine/threonine protein phosphatase PrpC